MKRLIIVLFVIGTSLIATTGYSQVVVHARVNFGIPAPRVYYPPTPPVVCEDPSYSQPEPYYNDYGRERVVVIDRDHRYDRYDHDRYNNRGRGRYDRERERFHDRGHDRDRRGEHGRNNW